MARPGTAQVRSLPGCAQLPLLSPHACLARSPLHGARRRQIPPRRRDLALSIAALCVAIALSSRMPEAQAQVVVENGTQNFTGPGSIDLTLTVGSNGIANFSNANWLIGTVPGVPRIDVLNTGALVQTDSVIRLAPGAQLAINAGGTYTIAGASAILSPSNDVSDVRVTSDGVFDLSQVTTALPLSTRVDLADPVDVPANAGVAIGSLAGSGTVNMADRVLITGLDGSDSAFSGTVVQGTTGRFVKAGAGTMTINDAQFQGGETYVGEGAFAQTGGNTSISYLSLGIGSGALGTFNISGGNFTLGRAMQVGDFGGTGVVNQTGGAVVLLPLCGNPANCVSLNLGNQGGNGTWRLSGGSLTLTDGFLVLGRNTDPNPASTGLLEISGSGHAILGSGATLVLGNNNAASSTGSGTINQSGGLLTVENDAFLNLSGSGTGTYNLTGGTLQIGGASLVNNYLNLGGSYALNLGGGTVQAWGTALSANADATLSATSTLDSNGLGITWNGVLAGEGALTKTGAGTLTLTALNRYHGPTLIAEGTLALSGASGLYTDFVFDNARLTNNGVFDITQVSTPLPLSSRVDLSDPVNAPANAGAAVGSLAGSGTVNMADRVLVTGLDNSDSAFSGTVVQGTTGRFIKIGSGTMTINGAQFQGGETFVGAGAFAQGAGATGISYLSLGIGAGAQGRLEVSGGTLTVGTVMQVGDFGGTGSVNQAGGSVVLTPLCGNPANCVGLNIGNQGGSGTYSLSGGTLDFSQGFVVLGRNTDPNPASTGVLDISGSGHATFGPGSSVILGNNNAAANLGSGTINQSGGTLTVDNGAFLYLSGSGAGTYNLNGGTLQIGGSSLVDNYLNLGGSYALNLGGGTVQAYGSALIADANATLSGGSTLDSNGLSITWNGMLSGAGALNKAGAGTLTLNAGNSYAGGTNVLAGTLAVVRNDVLGSGAVTLSEGATVSVAPTLAGDFVFNNAFASATAGAGLFTVALADPADNFAFANASGQYQGTVQLGASQFALSGINAAALSAATLRLESGNTTTVGAGEQAIGGLQINGGQLDFSDVTLQVPNSAVAGSWISTGSLALLGGQIVIDYASSDLQHQPGAAASGNLLSQDDDIQVALVRSRTAASGSASNLSLIDRDTQQPIGDPFSVNVIENGNVVAVADYDFIFNSVDASGAYGLFVGYGLRELAIQDGQILTLAPAPGASGLDTDLAALLTGSGSIAIAATGNEVSLSNSANDYSGQTQVLGGTLRLGSDHALGLTSLLDIAPGASVNIGGYAQSVGKLIAQPGSHLQLDGVLTITDAQRASGDPSGGALDADTLSGGGTLNIDPSIVEVNGANAGYSGNVNLIDGSQVILNNAQGLGSAGTVTLTGSADVLTFGEVNTAPGVAPAGSFSKQLAGPGIVQLRDAADIALAADNSGFSGLFDLAAGTALAASQANQFGSARIVDNGTLALAAASDWTLTNAVTGLGLLIKTGGGLLTVDTALAGFGGSTHVDAGTLQLAAGGAMAGDARIAAGARLLGQEGAAIAGPIDNAGTLQAAGSFSVGALSNSGTVQLAGPRVGNVLTINGNYQGQGGTLLINTVLAGDDSPTDRLIVLGNTGGSTGLRVNGIAGGSQGTSEGIRVVQVDGQSNGVFALQGRAVGGLFEYGLFQGSVSNPADGDWYLRTQAIRPEVGAYLGNQYASITLLRQTMRERTGEPAFVEVGEDNTMAAWARYQGQQVQSGLRLDGLQQDLRVETHLLQFGVELLRTLGASGRWHAGLMGAHGETTSDATSMPLGLAARGRVTGDAIGAYGTWFSDASAATGFHVDAWLQYARFDNKVRGAGLPEEKYDADSWTASAELGYAFALRQGAASTLYLEPQLQAIYTDYSADNHVEANMTEVRSGRTGGLTTRLGVRLHGRSDNTQWNRVQPFVEVNWWNNDRDNEVIFDGRRVQQQLPGDVYEARAGFEAELGDRWSGTLSIGLQDGSDGYRNVVGGIGLRAAW
ncbi:MAG TPA: autotransporter outer membrane beta-barrel domain-containing protein [Stenotrophomonas sp.]|nr:autotransporter outer membrane beta-barrel domain-containing protein [Stenotrophomonas sp.]